MSVSIERITPDGTSITCTTPAPLITTSSVGTVIACSRGSSTTCVVTHSGAGSGSGSEVTSGDDVFGRLGAVGIRRARSVVDGADSVELLESWMSSAVASSLLPPLPESVRTPITAARTTPATPRTRIDRRGR